MTHNYSEPNEGYVHKARLNDYEREIPMGFLTEGTTFLARHRETREAILCVADMDGHSVSLHYGSRTGNTHYADNPDRNYINMILAFNQEWTAGRTGYQRHNITLFEKDWTVQVKEADYRTYLDTVKATEETLRVVARSKRLAQAEESVRAAQAVLDSLRANQ